MSFEYVYRDWKRWDASSFGALAAEEAACFRAEIARCQLAGGPLDVLELGFGNGSFLAFCSRSGWSVTGIEADEELVRRAREHGFEAHHSAEPIGDIAGDREFDLIAAFDVFEHIETDALIGLLAELKSVLKPSGRILARFPSGDSPFSGAMYHGDMTHRSYLGSGKVQQIAIAAGLELVSMTGAALPLRGVGLRRASRRIPVLLVRRLIFGLFRAAFYANTARVLDPNAVAIFANPQRV